MGARGQGRRAACWLAAVSRASKRSADPARMGSADLVRRGGLRRPGRSYPVRGAGGCGGRCPAPDLRSARQCQASGRRTRRAGEGGRGQKKAAGERRRREQQRLIFLTWHVYKALC